MTDLEGRVRTRRYRYRGQTKSTGSGERKERLKKRKLGSESRVLPEPGVGRKRIKEYRLAEKKQGHSLGKGRGNLKKS